jgi:hypothetical protein
MTKARSGIDCDVHLMDCSNLMKNISHSPPTLNVSARRAVTSNTYAPENRRIQTSPIVRFRDASESRGHFKHLSQLALCLAPGSGFTGSCPGPTTSSSIPREALGIVFHARCTALRTGIFVSRIARAFDGTCLSYSLNRTSSGRSSYQR